MMKCTTLLFAFFFAWTAHAFVPPSLPKSVGSTSLRMVVGPKQALAVEKMKNAKKFESTIVGLMKTKKLTRDQAEKRYGAYLIDPDGFALRAGEEAMKADGYKSWEDAAVGRSDDPEATRERIDAFKRKSTTKALAVIFVFCGVLLYSSSNHVVPTVYGGLIDTPTTNPYRAGR